MPVRPARRMPAVRIRVSAIRGPGACATGTADGLPCTTDADCKNQCAAIPLICPAAFGVVRRVVKFRGVE